MAMIEDWHTGEWFLPGSNDKRPGRLSYDEKGKRILLHIFGTSFMDGTAVKDEERKRPATGHDFINGDARGTLSLYQCTWTGTKELGKDLHQIEYLIGYVIYEKHIASKEEFLVTGGEFMFPQLKSFFDLDLTHGRKSIFVPEYNVNDRTVVVSITDRLSIQFLDRVNERAQSPVDERQYRTIRFIYNEPVPFTELLEDAVYFKKLIEFSYGRPCTLAVQELLFPDESVSRIWNTSLNKGEKVSQHLRPGYHMLISQDNFEEDGMLKAIRLWFKYRDVSSMFDFYLDSNYWFDKSEQKLSNVMFNNRFLNIVQGLENFHRNADLFKEDRPDVADFHAKKKAVLRLFTEENKDLKQWLNDHFKPPKELSLRNRLDALIKWLQPEIDKWFAAQSTIRHFAWYASAMRNLLSHGRQKRTKQGDELRVFFLTGQILLAACILKALKVKDVTAAVLHYQQFQDHLFEINRSLIKIDGK